MAQLQEAVGRSVVRGASASAPARGMSAPRVPGVLRPPATRPGIFDANFGITLTADYADGVREGSHPKAKTQTAGRAGVIAPPPPRHKVKALVAPPQHCETSAPSPPDSQLRPDTAIDHAMFTFSCHGNREVTNGDTLFTVVMHLIKVTQHRVE